MASTMKSSAAIPAEAPREWMGHPVGLYGLAVTEMWERFSFYSMRAFLVLYIVKVMLLSQKMGNEIYGAYLGFVYAAPFIGGMLADRLLGQRIAIYIGGVLMATSQFTLAFHAWKLTSGSPANDPTLNAIFFTGLGLLAAGNGFFKPNISTIVGSLYRPGDPRRDGAFTIFYMGINVGALLAAISGQVAEKVNWHWGFVLAGSGMIVGLIIFTLARHTLGTAGLPPRPAALSEPLALGIPKLLAPLIGVLIFVPIAAFFIARPGLVQALSVWVAIPVLAYLIWEAARGTREEAGRITVILVLCTFSMVFWAFFELAGSAVNLFTDAHVERHVPIFGELTASFLTASINPFFILVLGIPFARLWVWLNKHNAEPPSPLKFALGLAQLGAGFFVMYLGAAQAGPDGRCNLLFLVLGFLLHTTGELCLSPVGLSTITKMSPARLVGTFMGCWFLSSSLGNVLGGYIGGKTEHYGFDIVFYWIAITGFAAGALLLILTPILKRMSGGVK